MCVCVHVWYFKQCSFWKMPWERTLNVYWRISRVNTLLIGCPVSQWPLFRRGQSRWDVLMRALRYVPLEHNPRVSFANSRAGIGCCPSRVGNGFKLIYLYFLIFHPLPQPPVNTAIYFIVLRQTWGCSLLPWKGQRSLRCFGTSFPDPRSDAAML